MLTNMLKSFLPDDFDMEASINQAKQFMLDTRAIAEGVKRIEQKLDSEIVTLRDRVTALESQGPTLLHTEGERNDNGSNDHGATYFTGDGATGDHVSG